MFEYKSPNTIAPVGTSRTAGTGVVHVDPDRATVRMIAAVTGTVDEVGDRIVPGAFRRSLASRTPKVCRGHDWNTPIGRVVEVRELMPGDAALPRRTGSGRPWPREAGALIATVRLNTAVREGKDAMSNIAFFGSEAAFSIGYKALKTRQRGAVRELLDVELYEVSPVLFGAHPDARVYAGAKTGRPAGMETKAVPLAASVAHTTGKRYAIMCGNCEQPVALANRPLRKGTSMICEPCIDTLGRLTDVFDLPDPAAEEVDETEAEDTDDGPDFGEFDNDRAPRIGAEDAYGRAQAEEVEHEMQADGSLTRSQPGRRRWQP